MSFGFRFLGFFLHFKPLKRKRKERPGVSLALFPSVIDGKVDRQLLLPPHSKDVSNQIQQRKLFHLSRV